MQIGKFNNEISNAKFLNTGLYLLLFTLPWQTIWIIREPFVNGYKWEYGVIGFYAVEILLWISAILFIFWYWKKFRIQDTRYKIQITKDRVFAAFCLLFTVYTLLSSLWAADAQLAYQHGLRIMGTFILFFMLWLGPITFTKAARWFVAGATLQSLLGIWQFLTQSTFALKWLGLVEHPVYLAGTSIVAGPEIGRWVRAYGAFPHPNIFGGYLVVSIVLIGYMLLNKTGTCHTGGKKTLTLYYAALMLQMAALFFTFSRSAWLAYALGLFLFILKHAKTFKTNKIKSFALPITLFLILPTLLTAIFWPLVKTRISLSGYNEVASVTERTLGYDEAVNIIKNNSLLGVGTGNYTRTLIEAYPNKQGWSYQPVHNVPLLILAELGIIGTILLLCTIITFLIYLNSQSLLSRSKICLLFTVYCLLIIFDHYMYSSFTGLALTGVFFGLILNNLLSVNKKSPPLSPYYPRLN